MSSLTEAEAQRLFAQQTQRAFERAKWDREHPGEPIPLNLREREEEDDEEEIGESGYRGPTEEPRHKVPPFMDLDETDEDTSNRYVKLNGRKFDIGPVSTGASRRMGWYQKEIGRINKLIEETTEEEEAERLDKVARTYQEKMTKLLIPSFDVSMLEELSLGKYRRMMNYFDDIVRADMGMKSRAEEEAEAKAKAAAGETPDPNSSTAQG